MIALLVAAALAAATPATPCTTPPPCRYEDQISPSCRWDATTAGNGRGESFTVLWDGHNAFVVYDNGEVLVTDDGSHAD